MLIILAIGFSVLAVGGWFLHRRYHRRRESQWALAPGPQPDINTWGPGQSVHDLSFGATAANDNEKGKTREQTRAVQQPARVHKGQRERSGRFSGRFF